MGKKINYGCICGESDPKNFYKTRKGTCKSCVLKDAKNKYNNLTEEDKSSYIKKQGKWQDNNFLKYRLLQAKSRAKSKGIVCEIDVDYLKYLLIKQNNKCFYSGIEMEMNRAGSYTASIDRIDSNKGYVVGNIVFVIWAVNTMKNDLSEDEFLNIIKLISEKQSSKF